MKKKIILLLVVVCLTLFGLLKLDKKEVSNNRVYFIGNDVDEYWTKKLYMIPVLSNDTMPSFEEDLVTLLKDVPEVKNIAPYYPMKVEVDEQGVLNVDATVDGKKQMVNIPTKQVQLETGEMIDVKTELDVLTYLNKSFFLETNAISKTFGNDNGIYVTQALLDDLGLKPKDQLTLEVLVSVPQTRTPVVEHVRTRFNPRLWSDPVGGIYEFDSLEYEVETYVKVPMTFEISGVVALYQEYDCLSIIIPSDMALSIVDQVEDKIKPIEYMVEVDKNLDIDSLGEILQSYISDFVLIESPRKERKIFD